MKVLSDYNKSSKVKVSCIYKVANTLNGKVYIGQTTNFRKRVSDYKNAHKKKGNTQAITKDIKKYGTENFTIEILEECSPKKLAELETKYIKFYRDKNPDKCYNYKVNNNLSANDEASRKQKSIAHIGLKDDPQTKRNKSNAILAIKGRSLIVCDSGKLFGDYVGKSKDMIKNGLRQPSKICGYRLYYDDFKKRQEIRNKMMKKRSIRDKGYIDMLNVLDTIELEGVETIYWAFDDISYLKYASEDQVALVDILDMYDE